MKKYNIINSCFFFLATLLLVGGCTKESDYYDLFTQGGEITYTGKIDSVEIRSGKNRVSVHGLLNSDPKVRQLRVYWDLRRDSIVVPIVRTAGVDTVSVLIEDLEENIYNFELLTFDGVGNRSVSQFVTAEVYGERYANSIFNRPLIDNVLVGNNLTVNFASMDLSSGVIGSELLYTSVSGEQKTVYVPIQDASVQITDFMLGSSYELRTAYLPERNAIDTFYTGYLSVKPVGVPALGNAASPFMAAENAGRWGILAEPWITNEPIKNHGGFGGWDGGCCDRPANTFNVESGWGSPEIVNGKIYQTVTADAGTYLLKVNVYETNFSSGDDQAIAYLAIATGNGLPDVEEIPTSPAVLGSKRITGAGVNIVEFTVAEDGTEISIGEVTTQLGNYYCVITSFELAIK
ncbi:DUF4998 domain-containing protein [Flavilitoribacter nigricans]|uniref:DUF5013 domain-containing protein n=1 Tax=Flavilitoribacter nigricans (strain ATCC 23147 / DSM 23189 / NBRC 102662 / NCIMB 1420 / SS-2) TaxID=1122177 RepID=A0A2D0N2U7_FLAN2|nr:DUF4998 domain-containing protein [Flavilitoribacter nigricans]PHN02718.1 hypothetical protein CRP01_30510 [Flavilitoribacter nigricans DSM 23189 = NBRC 102662]